MRICVLGGTRFIGRAIVDALVTDHDLLVVHRGESEPEGLPEVEHLHADRRALGDGPAADRLRAFDPEVVIDCIAVGADDTDAVLGAFGGDHRLVVLSSMDTYRAYGSLHAGVVTDAVPLDENSPVRSERYPYRGSVPGMDHRGNALLTHGDVGDIARGIVLLVAAVGADVEGQIFNFGEDRTPTVRLRMEAILREAGATDVELVSVPDDVLPADLGLTAAIGQHLLVSSAKARAVLGWQPSDPETTLGNTVRWHLGHPPAEDDADFTADDHALAAAAADS